MGNSQRSILITCPSCGKLHQKSRVTDSIIICSKCKYEYYYYLKNGVCISIPAEQMRSQTFVGQVNSFTAAIDNIR